MKKLKKKTEKKMLIFIGLGILLIAGGIVGIAMSKREADVPQADKDEGKVEEPRKDIEVIDLDSDSRPYAVMINNNSAVWRYQSGMNDAYIVYEMLVEGGITREMALFKRRDIRPLGMESTSSK